MKRILLFPAFFIAMICDAQFIAGNWEGVLNVQGTELPLVFHIKDSAGKKSATFDSPKQMAYGLPFSDVQLNADTLRLIAAMLNAKYEAVLNAGLNHLDGKWYQGGQSFALQMKQTSTLVSNKTFNRPQTPRPPFDYFSDSVIYSNADKSIQFGGTITRPMNKVLKRYPAILLITGSGQQDRDETLFEHKPFAVIADYLTKKGFVVLRVDDRGIGKTTGSFSKSTTADFVQDAAAAIEYLKTLHFVDTNSIGLVGHSEGAMIAPMLAANRKDVRFIVMLAGPGIPIVDLMNLQSSAIAASNGASKSEVELYEALYKNLVTAILNEPDAAKAKENATGVFTYWQQKTPAEAVLHTTGVTNEASAKQFVAAFVQQLRQPWMNYFMRIHPADYLSKVNCKVLALNGEKDIQVAAAENIGAIRAIMQSRLGANLSAEILPGLNHLFQHCQTCTVDEYVSIEETIAPELLQRMAEWLKQATNQ